MDKSLANHCVYEFGAFSLDAAQCVLRRGDETVALTPKAFETLLVLVKNGGRIVQKQELLSAVWPDTFVEESNLTFNISVLRKTLHEGDEPGEATRYIETVSKRGYRFVAPVREIRDAATLNKHSNTVEINGNGAANDNGTRALFTSTQILDADDPHEGRASSAIERARDAAIVPQSDVETTGRDFEAGLNVVAGTATTTAGRSRTMPRWLLAVVPLCLLLAGVGAWQGWQQGNRARQESNAGSLFVPKPLSPQSGARALYLKGRLLWTRATIKI